MLADRWGNSILAKGDTAKALNNKMSDFSSVFEGQPGSQCSWSRVSQGERSRKWGQRKGPDHICRRKDTGIHTRWGGRTGGSFPRMGDVIWLPFQQHPSGCSAKNWLKWRKGRSMESSEELFQKSRKGMMVTWTEGQPWRGDKLSDSQWVLQVQPTESAKDQTKYKRERKYVSIKEGRSLGSEQLERLGLSKPGKLPWEADLEGLSGSQIQICTVKKPSRKRFSGYHADLWL